MRKIKRAESSSQLSALLLPGVLPPNNNVIFMICFVAVLLKDIFEQGKYYPWPRPADCLRCNRKFHGHGFTTRYFQGFPTCLYLKCYRCPECGCVITLRPDTHFSRIRSDKNIIRAHLAHRLTSGQWPRSSLSRSSLRHWLANLSRQMTAHLTAAWKAGLLAAFDCLLAQGLNPVTRLI